MLAVVTASVNCAAICHHAMDSGMLFLMSEFCNVEKVVFDVE